ncbi:MAG: NUDIX hydrolase [Clostridia bacterium]|nr:NUDIX hydrolase [Clostridia bacterium]
MEDRIVQWAAELQSLAQAGLYYGKDAFDRERYARIREISAEMMAERTGLPAEKVTDWFCADSGYQTPKVDTRAVVFLNDQILLVREKDGLWTLPGGWCEFNLSPVDNVIKEAKEEAGLDVVPVQLLAAQDRDRHNQPPYPCHVVKLFYLCVSLGGDFAPNAETTARGWFALDALPPLCEAKCTAEQIALCFELYHDPLRPTQFD